MFGASRGMSVTAELLVHCRLLITARLSSLTFRLLVGFLLFLFLFPFRYFSVFSLCMIAGGLNYKKKNRFSHREQGPLRGSSSFFGTLSRLRPIP